MANANLCSAGPVASPNLQMKSCMPETRSAKCSFSIESILSLDKKKDFASTVDFDKPHKPCESQGVAGHHRWHFPGFTYTPLIQVDLFCNLWEMERTAMYEKYRKDEEGLMFKRELSNCNLWEMERNAMYEKYRKDEEGLMFKRELSWCRGRRQRTAYSRNQIEILENSFRENSYPGIALREELAKRLTLNEDRIQIWFQNRRAKQKRCHRESQFLMVKNSLTPNIRER